uniref:Uncharacterized protein n=1 Tax=Anopheles maculatus TaxID=74869 RepID=A0A182SC69_9DIPT
MASEAFLHTDLVGNNYVCFLQSRACRLTLLQYDDTRLCVSCTHMLLARSAVSLAHINMIVVLEPTGRLVLYSGPIAVGKLHVTGLQSDCFRTNPLGGPGAQPPVKQPSFVPARTTTMASTPSLLESFPRRSTLLPNVSSADGKFDDELHLLSPVRPINLPGLPVPGGSRGTTNAAAPRLGADNAGSVVKLRDATGSRFTLVLANERHVRLALAPVAESQLVRNCVQLMRLVLPTATVHEFLIHWYNTRNVPGSHAGFSAHQEWDLFRTLLFTMMGRPIGPPDADDRVSAGGDHQPDGSAGSCVCADEPKKRRRGENSHGQAADWEFLVGHATDQPYVASGPVCPEATTGGASGGNGARPYQNREHQSLYQHIPDILQTFHLLYEDLKLNVCRTDDLRLLADFLYCLAADAQLDAYQLHYRTDFPELFDRYRRPGSCVIADGNIRNRLGGTDAPHIFRYIERMLAGDSDGTPYCYRPGINDLSYDMCTLVAFIYRVRVAHGWVRTHLESVLSSKFFAMQDNRPLCIQQPTGAGATATNRASCERTADTVLAFLVERGYTRTQLDLLPIAVRYVLLNYLESCRAYLTHGLQAVFYELLMRPELRAHSISSGLQQWVPDVELHAADALLQRNISLPKYGEIDAWQKEMSEIEICGTGST